ncbi:hypothetical protein [Methylomonas koyamae]|uniref:hypothetical protein n=1 Tax=Methylomonas koyamae TaxID=702114 RepID=UPI00112B7A08|nr:hypothetical protein [Methylomonas koyamae]TPQ24462.1 hypothetical protein C2U68_19645 [Methylomonas koyamae]
MVIKTWLVILGGLTAVGLFALIFFLAKSMGITFGVYAGAMLVFYILAASTVSAATGFSEFIRGMLVGSNASLNGLLIFELLSQTGNAGLAQGVAIGLFGLNLLAIVKWISQFEVYQALIGWSNWFLPMSWPIVLLGLLFLLFSLLLAAVTGFQVQYLKLQGLRVDWPTGTIFVKGGLISNLNVWDTAFNMGNFAFVDMNSGDWHIEHESGHSLNLGAFGFIFHLLGAVDELVFRQGDAYSERLADSNAGGGNNIPMWA